MEPFGCVVVSGKRNLSFVWTDDTRYKVLITAIVSSERQSILDIQAPGLMFDHCRSQIDASLHVTLVGIAVIRGNVHICGPSLKRGNAAVRYAVIMEVFVAERDSRPVRHHRDSGID